MSGISGKRPSIGTRQGYLIALASALGALIPQDFRMGGFGNQVPMPAGAPRPRRGRGMLGKHGPAGKKLAKMVAHHTYCGGHSGGIVSKAFRQMDIQANQKKLKEKSNGEKNISE